MESVILEKEAMKLTPIERAFLADRLLQTLDADKDAVIKAWTEVSAQRLNKFHSGKMDAFDGQAVIDSLRKELK